MWNGRSFYARAENPEKDVLIHPASLSDLVNQAVQAHRALLLQNGVSVELCDLDFVVYTDRKWVCFLLGAAAAERSPIPEGTPCDYLVRPKTGETGGTDRVGQRDGHSGP